MLERGKAKRLGDKGQKIRRWGQTAKGGGQRAKGNATSRRRFTPSPFLRFGRIRRLDREPELHTEIHMKNAPLEERIQTLARWLYESRHPVVFTGAGISTESGLPDFRGPDGLWTRRDKGLPPKQTSRPWRETEPNQGHYAIAELQKTGKLKFLISQNVDNLHLKSGIRPDLLAELHGNLSKMRCTACGQTVDRSLEETTCKCGGTLVKSVVDFGQSLPEKDLTLSFHHSQKCDLFIVVGSSLVVTPAADMPLEALRAGARLVIINKGDTPFDGQAHLRFQEGINDVLPKAVRTLKKLMGLFE